MVDDLLLHGFCRWLGDVQRVHLFGLLGFSRVAMRLGQIP